MIKRAKSGEIENERTTGTGISFSDLTGQLTNADLLALQNEVNDLQDEMMLKDVQSELAELENETRSLERDLGELRAKGYAVEKNLEVDISVLISQWSALSPVLKNLKSSNRIVEPTNGSNPNKISSIVGDVF